MTREEAISIMKVIVHMLEEKYDTDRVEEAVDMAIKALEQEPCEDAISRQAALEKIHWLGLDNDTAIKCDLAIRALPSVNPQEPKTGHWIAIDEEPHEVWECDHCGFVIDGSGCIEPYEYRDTYKYCPNCGARMVELQEREETQHE